MATKQEIILRHYHKGESERQIARGLKISRTTVRRYLILYQESRSRLFSESAPDSSLSEDIVSAPRYNTDSRQRRKLTDTIACEVDRLLDINEKKRARGQHKQMMKKVDILEYLQEQGHDIGYTTICNYVSARQNRTKEAFIRQVYNPGDVCEFDWGEARLDINGQLRRVYMAVFTPAKSNYRYSQLFYRQDTASFLQAHADFFAHVGGVYRMMVYDNMRVAIRRFVGPTEKEPTEALQKLSMYYQFGFRFCNIQKGNEKGHVERSVEFVRRKAFCVNDSFPSIESANRSLQKTCNRLNTCYNRYTAGIKPLDLLKAEKPYLMVAPPPYESATMEQCKADKYSVIMYMTNRYSVPDNLVGKILDVKVYAHKLICYHDKQKVCEHPRGYGKHDWHIDLNHYLRTLRVKPGALAGSQALASAPQEVKTVFDKYFAHCPRDFVELLLFLRDNDLGFDKVTKAIRQLMPVCPHNISADMIKAICLQQTAFERDKTHQFLTGNDQIAQESLKQLKELNLLLT